MIRRHLLLGILAGSTALAGCQYLPKSTAAWFQDASILSGGLAAIAPQLATLTGITQEAETIAQNALQAAANFAKSLAGVTDANAALPLITQVQQAVQAAFTALAPFIALLPPEIAIALAAVQALLPVIWQVVSPASVPAAPQTIYRATMLPSMSPDRARLILKGLALR